MFRKSSVRLACVRHAASVHPEPGSNSLKIISNRPSERLDHFQSFNRSRCHLTSISVLRKLLFVRVLILKKSSRVLFLSLFNFQCAIRACRPAVSRASRRALRYHTKSIPVCQHLFCPFLSLLLNDAGCFFLVGIKDLVVLIPRSNNYIHIWWFFVIFRG